MWIYYYTLLGMPQTCDVVCLWCSLHFSKWTLQWWGIGTQGDAGVPGGFQGMCRCGTEEYVLVSMMVMVDGWTRWS